MLPDSLAPFPGERRPALAGIAASAGWHWRALRHGDLPWLATLYASTREEELRPVPWPESSKQQFLMQQFIAQHRHYLDTYRNAHYLAILWDGQPVGRFYIDEDGTDDLIVDISLMPSWRGRGIGAAVIGCQLQASAARGRGVALHVMQHNHGARRLYERLGFAATEADAGEPYLPMRWQAASLPIS
jgi:GNAT superfamily N-acetyltransferase